MEVAPPPPEATLTAPPLLGRSSAGASTVAAMDEMVVSLCVCYVVHAELPEYIQTVYLTMFILWWGIYPARVHSQKGP